MPSSKLLNGVAHEHLSKACRAAGMSNVTLDLMKGSPLPASVPDYQPLRLSTQALHRTFVGILEKTGFTLTDVSSATLTFHFLPDAQDDYSYFSCDSVLITTKGRSYGHEAPAWATTCVMPNTSV